MAGSLNLSGGRAIYPTRRDRRLALRLITGAVPAPRRALAVNRPLEELSHAELLAIAAGIEDEAVPPATEH